jgi:putative endonuclease
VERGLVIKSGSSGGESDWHVYVILCSDDSLYTGITTDVARRFSQHGSGHGARYFRGRQPRELVYLESGHTRSSAGRREVEIKGMTRAAKTAMIQAAGPVANRLDVSGGVL